MVLHVLGGSLAANALDDVLGLNLLVPLVFRTYLELAVTWLMLGRSSFQRVRWADLWRICVVSYGAFLMALPVALACLIAYGAAIAVGIPLDRLTGPIAKIALGTAMAYGSARLAFTSLLVLDRGANPLGAVLGSLAISRGQVGPLLLLTLGPAMVAWFAESCSAALGGEKGTVLACLVGLPLGLVSLAANLAVGQRYLAAPAKDERASLLRDPLFLIGFGLAMACLAVAGSFWWR